MKSERATDETVSGGLVLANYKGGMLQEYTRLDGAEKVDCRQAIKVFVEANVHEAWHRLDCLHDVQLLQGWVLSFMV